jgi:hypothetical protein
MKIVKLYNIYIYERYKDLINSGKNKETLDNNDMWKIFEWYTCIMLSKQYNKTFYEYDDIHSDFKETNRMSRTDTGIDCCDLENTIVQCKLRNEYLNWGDCSTFFASQNIYNKELKQSVIRWPNLIISRNKECKLSDHLMEHYDRFIDNTYMRNDLISYCDNLLENPPKYPKIKDNDFVLRTYQEEAINIIKDNKKNVTISLPTGTGKNIVIIYSIEENKKFLILVPRIILMEQLKEEIIRHKPELKNTIQCIGDNNNDYNTKKNICICVYNSVGVIEKYFNTFEKIFVDEAHHIDKPQLYAEIEDENNNELESDNEDEQSDNDEDMEQIVTTNYNKIIKDLTKYNNNVYLSATIDCNNDFIYYKKDIRDMIEMKYLCDYTIHVPIFSNDPTNKNICVHLVNNYRNHIIYCNSRKEGKAINNIMNSIMKGCSEYIDCMTSKSKRDSIIKKYKNGDIPFLVNVRILVEGFDAPITKGICFMHLPSSKTTLIQIIGRALRLHKLKTIANIILPFSSDEDSNNINNFLQVMAKNDKRIMQSYMNKKEGGYISIDNVQSNNMEIEANENCILRYEMIYSSMGSLMNGPEVWIKKLADVKAFIDKTGKRPSEKNKDDKNIRKLGKWITHQQEYYANKQFTFTNQNIVKEWETFINDTKYKELLLSLEDRWFSNMEKVKKYIDANGIRPHEKHKDENIRCIGVWLRNQIKYYKNNMKAMKNDKYKEAWKEFVNDEKYNKHFISHEDNWFIYLEKVKKYLDDNNKRPSSSDNNDEIKFLGSWIVRQIKNYSKNEQLMENKNIRNSWEEFMNNEKYKKYFISNDELWLLNIEKIKDYISKNNKHPSQLDKNEDISYLGKWLSHQSSNYENKTDIMKNENIRKIWEDLKKSKYKECFMTFEELWYLNIYKLKHYIKTNNKRPSSKGENEERKLALWINTQNKNYKEKIRIMTNINILKSWEEFINDKQYKKYFMKEKIVKNEIEV